MSALPVMTSFTADLPNPVSIWKGPTELGVTDLRVVFNIVEKDDKRTATVDVPGSVEENLKAIDAARTPEAQASVSAERGRLPFRKR